MVSDMRGKRCKYARTDDYRNKTSDAATYSIKRYINNNYEEALYICSDDVYNDDSIHT